METFAVDRSLYEMGENDLKEIWDQDFDSAMPDAFASESDWSALLDHQLVILNDRMMTDALQSPRITSEHSYSLVTNDELPESPLDGSRLDLDQDLESECFPAIPMTTATSGHSETFIKQEPISAPNSPQSTSTSSSPPHKLMTSTTTPTPSSTGSQSLLKQPTIILATRPSTQRCFYVPKMNIKMESVSPGFSLPPTPPSSTSSDSEGSLSPVHTQQPSSPSMLTSTTGNGTTTSTRRPTSLGSMGTRSNNSNTPLISSQPKGATGLLMLTEEEKRTLVAEGYPIPSKLPLTKAEEKSLKKIRRKIKNKISAQESRRKKKEYMDSLEKKVEALHSENSEYKRRVDSLETNNKSLLSQLHKLQALVGQMPNRIARNMSTQTAPLLVLVFGFMLTFGLWGSSFSLISSPFPAMHVNSAHKSIPGMPAVKEALNLHQDPYSTPNKRSRFLFSHFDKDERDDDEVMCKDFPFAEWVGFSPARTFKVFNPNIADSIDDQDWHRAVVDADTKEIISKWSTSHKASPQADSAKATIETTLIANLTTVLDAPVTASVKQIINITVA